MFFPFKYFDIIAECGSILLKEFNILYSEYCKSYSLDIGPYLNFLNCFKKRGNNRAKIIKLLVSRIKNETYLIQLFFQTTSPIYAFICCCYFVNRFLQFLFWFAQKKIKM